jgi:hypothetical protein
MNHPEYDNQDDHDEGHVEDTFATRLFKHEASSI